MDLQHPKEVFKGILDLSSSLRQELTSLLLDMLTTSRDFEILSTHVVSIMHVHVARLPNAQMLNIWLNIKNNCSMKKIKNRGMSCNSLWIPAFVV